MNETHVKRTMQYTFDISDDGDDTSYHINVKNHDHDAGVYVMRHTSTIDNDIVRTCIAHFAMSFIVHVSFENLDGIMCLCLDIGYVS
jgi:hypothetical protein